MQNFNLCVWSQVLMVQSYPTNGGMCYGDGSSWSMTTMALEAFAPPKDFYNNAPSLPAWLWFVLRQYSSGGKERLVRVAKAGQTDILRLLIIGAMSRVNWLGRKSIPKGYWQERMMAQKPKMLVAITLANKMAGEVLAMLVKGIDYGIR